MDRCNNNFRSTEAQLEEFSKSFIWQDLLQELRNWQNRIQENLSAPSFDSNTGRMVLQKQERVLYDEMLRGSLHALSQVEQLPEIVLEIVKQNNKENENADG